MGSIAFLKIVWYYEKYLGIIKYLIFFLRSCTLSCIHILLEVTLLYIGIDEMTKLLYHHFEHILYISVSLVHVHSVYGNSFYG